MKPLPIFIGYDAREPLAYHVFAHSILRRTTIPVAIAPLVQPMLRQHALYTRDRDEKAATEFSLTRFLVPSLVDYEGLALFADCDMLMRADVADLPLDVPSWQGSPVRHTTLGGLLEHETAYDLDGAPAVWACQHDYTPRPGIKMDGQVQTAYPRKNWSSFMLFNARQCKNLTPAYVNAATPQDLHRFVWAGDDSSVGSLPLEWNHLVGEYEPNPDAKNLHYTLGGPWFGGLGQIDHAAEWYDEVQHMLGNAASLAAGLMLP